MSLVYPEFPADLEGPECLDFLEYLECLTILVFL
jgi:hypothetical protein